MSNWPSNVVRSKRQILASGKSPAQVARLASDTRTFYDANFSLEAYRQTVLDQVLR